MRRLPAVTVALATLVLSGCVGSSSGSNSSDSNFSNDPASLLAQRDGSGDISAYSAALDAWQAKCTESRVKDAGFVDFAYDDLRKHGVGESSRLTVMRHLTKSVPRSLAPTNCQSIAAAYLVLRERK